jgi:hypothetical protein
MSTNYRRGISRREFGRVSALVAGLAMVPARDLLSDTPPASPEPEASSPESPPGAEARALAKIVKLRYGARLDHAALKEIARGLDGGLKSAAALRKIPLANADEPAFRFRAWRSDGD